MKKLLLLACAALLTSLGASAQWTAPEAKLTTKQADLPALANFYGVLYHIGQAGYMTAGTAWNTHACLTKDVTSGLLWEFQIQGTNNYMLYSEQASHDHYLFRDVDPNVYTDWQSKDTTEGRNFEFIDSGGGMRIRSAADDPYFGINNLTEEDTNYTYALWCMGWDPDNDDVDSSGNSLGSNIGIFMLEPEVNDNYELEWAVLVEDDYNVFLAQTKLYNRLMEGIDAGIDQSELDPYAAYLTSTDLDELATALSEADEYITNWGFEHADEDNAVEVTSVIVNPTFEGSRDALPTNAVDATDASTDLTQTGVWFSTNMLVQNNKEYERYDPEAGELTSEYGLSNFAQNWRSDNDVSILASDIHQIIEDLPEGLYTLTADCLGTTASDDNNVSGCSLYAISGGVTYSTPVCEGNTKSSPGTGYPMTYSVSVIHFGGNLTVGYGFVPGFVKWFACDNFRLYYLGGVDNPGFLSLYNAVTQASAYVEGWEDETYIYSEATYLALSDEVEKANDLLFANDDDACLEEVSAVSALIDTAKEEVTAYTSLASLLDQMNSDVATYETSLPELSSAIADLYDDYISDYEDRAATIEDIEAWVDAYSSYVVDYVKSVLSSATADNPIDITALASDMDFSGSSFADWDYTSDTGNGTEDGSAAECWNSAFSCLQTLTDMPAGSYTLTASAFYRTAGYEDSWTEYTSGTPDILTKLTVAGATAPVVNIMAGVVDSDPTDADGNAVGYIEMSSGQYVPNNMTTAEWAFANTDTYTCEVSGYLISDGDLTFGIKNDGDIMDDAWSIWTDFHLYYSGVSTSALYDEVMRLADEALALDDEIGSAVNAADTKLQAAVGETDNVSEASSEAELLAVIAVLQEAIDYANESASLISAVMELYESYEGKVEEVESSDETLIDALEAMGAAISNEDFESNEQMQAWLDELPAMWTYYVQCDHLGATKDAPQDITAVIINPNFDEGTNDTSGATGWTFAYSGDHIGYSSTTQYEGGGYCFEFWNCTSFNMEQTIVGLAEGYYHVTVTAAYRAGNNSDALAQAWADSPEDYEDVVFHANKATVPLASAFEGKADEELSEGNGDATATIDGTTYYVPNTLISFYAYSQQESQPYLNEVDVFVEEGEDLTIGIRLVGNAVTYNWCPFDTFTISYLGNGDENMPDAIEEVQAEDEAAGSAIYDLAGRQVSKAAKGIYIINGKKVLVK